MSEQTEMELTTEEELQAKKDEIGVEISKAVDELAELGLDILLVANQDDLDIRGIWSSSQSPIIRGGLARIVEQSV